MCGRKREICVCKDKIESVCVREREIGVCKVEIEKEGECVWERERIRERENETITILKVST